MIDPNPESGPVQCQTSRAVGKVRDGRFLPGMWNLLGILYSGYKYLVHKLHTSCHPRCNRGDGGRMVLFSALEIRTRVQCRTTVSFVQPPPVTMR